MSSKHSSTSQVAAGSKVMDSVGKRYGGRNAGGKKTQSIENAGSSQRDSDKICETSEVQDQRISSGKQSPQGSKKRKLEEMSGFEQGEA